MTGDNMARKVLVADDSVTIQKVVGLTFASEDIELAYVDNGEEAIDLARQFRPDLVMADVLMPGKSGYEVCEAIKQDSELQHIPVLLLTGTFEPFDAERCRQVGADGTITKPFESQTLIRQVKELLARPATPRKAAQTPRQGPEPTSVGAGPEASVETPAAAPPLEERAEPDIAATGPSLHEPDPLDLEDENFGDELLETANGSQDLGAPATPTASPADEIEQEFEFTRDPEEVLAQPEPALRDSAAAANTEDDEGFLEPLSSTPTDPATAPPETRAEAPGEDPSSENGVWDLSDFEAVDESQIGAPASTPAPEGAESLWDEAAAEAIDIVESTNLHPEDDGFLLEEAAQQDSAVARALAEQGPEAPDMDLGAPAPPPDAGEAPDAAVEEDLGADLDLVELEEVPLETTDVETPPAEEDAFAQPPVSPEVPPSPPSEEDSFGVEAADEATSLDLEACELSEVSIEDLPELKTESPEAVGPAAEAPPAEAFPAEASFFEAPVEAPPAEAPLVETPPVATPPVEMAPAEAPPVEAPGAEAAAPAPQKAESPLDVAGLLSEKTTEVVRHAVRDAVEKVTWEAYGDLSETVVRAVQEKVEKIAWEVIPQMAETIIKEEIRRLKEGEK
jgi:CheY-like chemotaxis protein